MEVQISQDIRKYKTKDIGNFSFKEAVFVAVGLAAAFLTYKLAGDVSIAFIPLAIVLIIGFFKPHGMTVFQYIRTVGREKILMPKTLIWETDFEYNVDEFEKLYGKNIRIPTEWSVIQTGTVEKISKQDLARLAK